MVETETKSPSLREAFERWKASTDRAPQTVKAYGYSVRHLERAGLVLLHDITPSKLADFIEVRLREAPRQLHIQLAALYTTLGWLERLGEFPMERLTALRRVPRPTRFRKRRQLTARFLDERERLALVAAAKRTSRRAHLVVQVALLAGLRFGELRRTRWSEMDLGERPTLSVRFVPELGQAGRIKTYQERVVPVCRELRDLLAAVRPGDGAGFVFPRSVSDVTVLATERALRRELKASAEAAGLQRVDFPLLRHTRASTWLQAGVPAAKAAFWLGHSLEVFLDFYGAIGEGYDPMCELQPKAGQR